MGYFMLRRSGIRAAKDAVQDVAAGVAMFAIMLLTIGFMSLGSMGALSTDALSLEIAEPRAEAAMATTLPTAGILGTPPFYRSSVASPVGLSLSTSGTQLGIVLLAMMFALMGIFVRRSARHLRRLTAQPRRLDWSR